jgi:hypothetical protein
MADLRRPRKSRKSSTPTRTVLIRVAILGIFGVGTVSALAGYVLGVTGTDDGRFTDNQTHWVEAFAVGTGFRYDADRVRDAQPPALPEDPRRQPQQRCAALYFPFDAVGMAGCLQALQTPADGFRVPAKR